MTPVPGLLVAGGTAAAVLVVGLVFVLDVVPPIPHERPAAAQPSDGSDLTLEARRQARLTESQAMLGGRRPTPPEPEPTPAPAEGPLPPPASEPAEAPLPPPGPVADPAPPATTRKKARTPARHARVRQEAPSPSPAPPAQSADAGAVVALPAPGRPCTIATSGTSPVAEACRQGGVPEAKRTMKRLLQEAKGHDARFACEGCHADMDSFALRENARSEFTSLLAAAK